MGIPFVRGPLCFLFGVCVCVFVSFVSRETHRNQLLVGCHYAHGCASIARPSLSHETGDGKETFSRAIVLQKNTGGRLSSAENRVHEILY